jgi:hypothetical protein
MLKNNSTSSNVIEWESVRNKNNRPTTNVSSKESSPKIPSTELNENYVPKGVRAELDNILFSSASVYEKIRDLNRKVNGFVKYKSDKNPDKIDWRKRLNIYIIHKSCKQNKHEIIASIIDSVKDDRIYSNAVSSTLSGNTCLGDAAYFGSDVSMSYLINRGADIHHKNNAGETIYDLIEIGRKDSLTRYPNATEMVDDRFNECIRLVKQAEEAERLPQEKKTIDVEEAPKSEFKDDYDFDTLKEDVLKYIENPPVFRKLIEYLKKNGYTMLLVRVLEEEDMEDILIDNPYVAKLV